MCESASMAKEEDKFMLQVQLGFPGLQGSELQVTAFANMAISMLKSSLAIASRTPALYQRLLTTDGQILSEDAKTLEELGLTAGSKLQLVRISPEKGTLCSVCSSSGDQAGGGVALLRYTLECCVDDPNEVGPTGTPLHLAALKGNLDICKVLLDSERFTAVNAKCALEGVRCYTEFTYPASTALHCAAARGHVDVCKLLLQDRRTQVNAKDGFGYTALHIAVAQHLVDVCAALLVHDSFDIEAEDQHGASALQVAIACCMPEDMKYKMHDLTQDGGCWSTSRRWTCLEKSFLVFELFMHSNWYKMNPKRLEDAFSNARRFLESGPEATRRPTIETLVAWWRLEAAMGIPQNQQQLVLDIQQTASEDVDLCAPLTGEQQREWTARVKRFAIFELMHAPEKVKASFEVMKVAVTEQGMALQYASDALRDNCGIVLAALTQQPRAFQFASERLQADLGLMFAALSKGFGAAAFYHTTAELKADRNIVIAVCEHSPMLFKYAAQELRADRDFVLEVLRRTSLSLNSFTEDLKVDREVLLAALAQDGNLLQDVPAAFQGDREIVLTAVAQNGCALEYVAEDLNMDREVVLTAVAQDGNALEYVAEELKGDREIVFAALAQDGSALEHAAEELQSDRETVTQAVLQDGLALQYAAEKFQSDYGIVIVAVAQDGNALEFAADELQMERNIVLAAVAQNGFALQHAAEQLRTDHEVVLRAVTQCGLALKLVSQECKGDHEIVRVAMVQNLAAVQYAAEKLQTNCDSLWVDFRNNLMMSMRLENKPFLLLSALVKVFQIEHCCALIVQEGVLEALVGLLCEETRQNRACRSNVSLRRLGLISQVFAILAMHGKYSDLIVEAGALEPLVAVLCEGDLNGEFGHAVFHAAFTLRFLTVGYKGFRSYGRAIMEAGACRPLQMIIGSGGDLESGIAMGAWRALGTVEMAFNDAPGP